MKKFILIIITLIAIIAEIYYAIMEDNDSKYLKMTGVAITCAILILWINSLPIS